jgi:photosystem II stability/assembly factor-like uncharacterized protein
MKWESAAVSEPSADYTDASGAPAYIHFIDDKSGWVVVKLVSSSNFSRGDLFQTIDGGASWAKLAIPIGDPVRFTTETDGWAAGGPAGDQLYVTRDGGKSWSPVDIEPPPGFGSSFPVYGLPVFSTVEEGVLPVTFAGDPSGMSFYRSADGGASWTPAVSGAIDGELSIGPGVVASDVVDANTWIAALPGGERVLKAGGAASAFAEVAPNGLPAGVNALDFANAQVGWAVVQTGECPPGLKTGCAIISRLLETSDGGQTWTELTP